MSDNWDWDSVKAVYYRQWIDEYGRTLRQEQSEQGPVTVVPSPVPGIGARDGSAHRPPSSSSRSQTHRAPNTSKSRRDPVLVQGTQGRAASTSQAHSSRHHDTGNYGTTPKQYDYQDTSSSQYNSGLQHEPTARDWASKDASTTDDLAGRMRSVSVSDEVAYTTASPATHAPYAPYASSAYPPAAASSAGPSDFYKGGTGKNTPGQTPQQFSTAPQRNRYVASTAGQPDKLNKSYQMRKFDYKKFFRVGRVFQTLWTEPWSDATAVDETFVSIVGYEQKAISKIRRFVVVHEGTKCCTCLPVTSYNGEGHNKKGITLSEHGFIYSQSVPKEVDGIDKWPLKVILSKGAEKLKERSLVHYGKVYTVETNVKVKDVGDLDSDSRKTLRYYFKQTFLSDDESSGSVPNTMPQFRTTELAGIGAGVSNPSYGQYTPSLPEPSYDTARGSTPSYYGTNNAASSYPAVKSDNAAYASSDRPTPGYSSGSAPTTGNAQDMGSQHQAGESYGVADNTSYTPHTASSAEQYSSASTSVPRSQRSDTEYHSSTGYSRSHAYSEAVDDEEITLPTIQEARESRHRRDSTTSSSKHGKHHRSRR